jgi:hypothetical protein
MKVDQVPKSTRALRHFLPLIQSSVEHWIHGKVPKSHKLPYNLYRTQNCTATEARVNGEPEIPALAGQMTNLNTI